MYISTWSLYGHWKLSTINEYTYYRIEIGNDARAARVGMPIVPTIYFSPICQCWGNREYIYIYNIESIRETDSRNRSRKFIRYLSLRKPRNDVPTYLSYRRVRNYKYHWSIVSLLCKKKLRKYYFRCMLIASRDRASFWRGQLLFDVIIISRRGDIIFTFETVIRRAIRIALCKVVNLIMKY